MRSAGATLTYAVTIGGGGLRLRSGQAGPHLRRGRRAVGGCCGVAGHRADECRAIARQGREHLLRSRLVEREQELAPGRLRQGVEVEVTLGLERELLPGAAPVAGAEQDALSARGVEGSVAGA